LDLSAARHLFPATEEVTFLDAAAVSLVPTTAQRELAAFVEGCVHPQARDASQHHIWMDRQRERAVREAARLLNCSESQIALVESTTHGLNITAQSLPLQEGDGVLIADTEFLQVAIPWRMKEAHGGGLRVTPVRSGEGGVLTTDDFAAAMGPETRAICVSSVQWCSGYRVDLGGLGDLCRERGVFLVVDAIQEMGACTIDLAETPVDVLVAGGHKWLNSPFGCGVMYLSPDLLERLEPPAYGYLALNEPPGGWGEYFRTPSISPYSDWDFQGTAKRFEIAGTSNYPGAIGLGASLSLINEIGIGRIHEHILALTDRLHDELRRLGLRVISRREPESSRSGITVFSTGSPEDDRRVLAALLERRVLVAIRYTSGVGGIRVSTHFFNDGSDLDRLVEGLEEGLALLAR
jgi:cysteine desulfurase / selenocysteine lyase